MRFAQCEAGPEEGERGRDAPAPVPRARSSSSQHRSLIGHLSWSQQPVPLVSSPVTWDRDATLPSGAGVRHTPQCPSGSYADAAETGSGLSTSDPLQKGRQAPLQQTQIPLGK